MSASAKRPHPTRSRTRRSSRPQVEALEGRLVLSGMTSEAAHALHGYSAEQARPMIGKIYTVSNVYSFQETAGNFAATNLAKVRGLRLYLTSGGRVANVVIPNTFYGTVSGVISSVKGHKNQYQFSATKTTASGVGFTASFIQVMIQTDKTGHPTAMAIVSRTGSSLGAVVNNTKFSSSMSSGYTAVVGLH